MRTLLPVVLFAVAFLVSWLGMVAWSVASMLLDVSA